MRRFDWLLPSLALLATGCIPAPRGEAPPRGTRAAPADDDERVRRAAAAPPSYTRQPYDASVAEDGSGPVTPAQVARPRPAWTARGVVADATDVAASVYVVRRGDTLRAISDRTGASAEAIARANGLAQRLGVRTGQRLSIPAGRYHLVRSGESGIAIARAYGVPWDRIVAENALAEPFILRAGQRLLLPPRPDTGASTLEERAAAFKLDIDDLITGSEPALARDAAPAAPVRTAREAVPATVPVEPPGRFAGRFDWPLTGPLIDRFGPLGGGRINEGINIGADAGTPIRAAADGVVAYVGSEIAVYGGLILIKHGGGWITTYGHAQELLVTRGQQVKRGQVIARAGETGSASEPMLHFEIRQGRKPVNPLGYLPRRG